MQTAFPIFLKEQNWDNHAVSLRETSPQQVENALNLEGGWFNEFKSSTLTIGWRKVY